MLTAPIIYLQGSGGNLVARSLTLDPDTVPYLPKHLVHTALTEKYTTEQRFVLYNNWNHKDWIQSEDLFIQYHCPAGDTALMQLTPLKLIQTFHPKQFEDGEKHGTWGHNPYWQDIIFIDHDEKDIDAITNYASLKRQDMPDHTKQVYDVELDCFENLKSEKSNAVKIHWQQLQTAKHFCEGIKSIAEHIGVEFYHDPVLALWSKWNDENKSFLIKGS